MNLKRRFGTAMAAAVVCTALANAQSGTIVTFDPPGSTSTYTYSINDHGVIVGAYADQNGAMHGYLRGPNGAMTTFDIRGAAQTLPFVINNKGAVTGYTLDTSGMAHGFLLTPGQSAIAFDVPGAAAYGTIPGSVNNHGDVAGSIRTAAWPFTHSYAATMAR